MKLTRKDYGKLQLIASDIGAQSTLLEMGAIHTKEKIHLKVDELLKMIDAAEKIEE